MSEKINLLFPVETISRELDFRLLLGCLCARADRRIWIGQPRVIYSIANCIHGDIYLGKNLWGLPPNVTWHRYYNLKKQGFKFIQLDEEGAVYYGERSGWTAELSRRFDPKGLQGDDYICTWGDFQRDYYKSLDPACSENIHTTGHPRFDMYKPSLRDYYAPETQRLRNQYGDFILINTNFSQVNHHWGLSRTFSERWGYHIGDPQKRLAYFDRWRHLSCTLVNFVRLVNRLSVEFPQLNIVLRPHPSENRDFYQPAFDGVPNVHVTREGSVGPWLFACRAMIHDGCTTGLEAFFGEVPIISYKPLTDPQHDLYLPNLFGVRCTSDEEVLEQVGRVIAAPAMPAAMVTGAVGMDRTGRASSGSSGRDDATSDHAVHGPSVLHQAVPEDACELLENFRGDAFTRLGTILDDAMATADIRASKVSLRQFTLCETLRSYEHQLKTKLLGPEHEGRENISKFNGLEAAGLEEKLERAQSVTRTRVKHTVHSGQLVSIEQ